jgi:hypothetical protein
MESVLTNKENACMQHFTSVKHDSSPLGQVMLQKQSSDAFLDVQNVPEGMYVLQIVKQGVHPEYFRASVSILH